MTAARRGIEQATGRASMPPGFSLASFASLASMALLWNCATGGAGPNPPLPNAPASMRDDGAVAGDDAPAGDADDDAEGDDATAGPPGDDAGAASTCNDALHELKALFVLPPVACSSSTDCASGSCCFVGPSSSTCVMQ